MVWYAEQVLRMLFMSLLVTGVATWRNLGFVDDFVARWLHAWYVSFAISLPMGIVIGRIAHKIVRWTGTRFTASGPIKKLGKSKLLAALLDSFRMPPT
ncbi:MAG: hypothetical protein A3J07_00845 [Candidatus Doudnabacteria bacterium RIFCSPLOWO2_02_FULL_49_13]|uniref:Uncharacterized protein n=1 Tax=Candidatus Doudnabacteria bacterium RIFCSPHIGHO2_12_FULL_48_16 TaxID=1817838 RepID=A0A1F5PKA6_9BACT|nr:MAG: hypothetical protein A3B77_03760 [Candidatus Doudnabacteria bacterium RIFCSPHIGHO2_02_FULL_49_24]OGE90299.1 MAG: hypothetical protein A3E29_04355 [Candidatus Doudnabacteria bacterium RIFCSPHIGHO2_12_FULL_48_16]OGF02355.1 MAG: hypothetical protein A3J07_00845 [Candidatus Doudnabacteria bacterium RIFCSPLOWO2_02_FULL_49_13]